MAVGVENFAARELGFDLIQGFLFAKPMGVQTFMRAIEPDPATVVYLLGRDWGRAPSARHWLLWRIH